jgi:cysteine-rich repeat protein
MLENKQRRALGRAWRSSALFGLWLGAACFDFGAAGPACGDGTLNFGEACDDGNTQGGDGCSAECVNEVTCGNGIQDAGEQCDDGNNANGDGCSAACQTEFIAAECDASVMSQASLDFCNEILLNLPENSANCRPSAAAPVTDFCAVSYSQHVLPNLGNPQSCGLGGCHGSPQFPPQGFGVNRNDAAFTLNNLLSEATETTGSAEVLQRIEAGDPQQSYVIRKLLGEGQPAPLDFDIVGSRMPLGQNPLCRDVIATVCFWAAAGAQDN